MIDKIRIEILSFKEKRLYLGNFTTKALSRFFPADLNPDLIWAVLRGYPHLIKYHGITSLKADQISLFNRRGEEIEIIDLYPESLLPEFAFFPEQDINLGFSGFQRDDGIYYAREVTAKDMKGGKSLILNNRKIVFNRTIPEQIFTMEKPPTFETFYHK